MLSSSEIANGTTHAYTYKQTKKVKKSLKQKHNANNHREWLKLSYNKMSVINAGSIGMNQMEK